MSWKVGDVAWSNRLGVVKCIHAEGSEVGWQRSTGGLLHTISDGRVHTTDLYPEIISIEEAKRRGLPMPKEKKKKVWDVMWSVSGGGFVYPWQNKGQMDDRDFQDMIGREGKLTFEWEEDM